MMIMMMMMMMMMKYIVRGFLSEVLPVTVMSGEFLLTWSRLTLNTAEREAS
jgi:hypothetical protein